MANVDLAIQFVLRQEDSRMTGNVTTLPGDSGGATRFGIASLFHPELVAQGFFDPARLGYAEALAVAESVYLSEYAEPMHIAQIKDQALATALFSMGINCGTLLPVVLLQRAVGPPLAVDGKMGPATETLVNEINPDVLLGTFCSLARRYYTVLAGNTPRDLPDLRGWMNRVAAWQSNAAKLRQEAKVVTV